MSKKNICLITNWYPTKENPYQGVFFKEQAIALEEYFNFKVVHYKEKKKDLLFVYLVRCLLNKQFTIEKINQESNTVEYDVIAHMPICIFFVNTIYDFYRKYVKHASEAGVGKYVSSIYQKEKRKILTQIFQEKCFDDIDVLYCINAQSESFTLKCVADAIKKPYVVAEHAPFPWPGKCIQDIEKRAIEQADLFMAISYDKIRQVLLQNVKLNKIAYVGNMVDEEQFVLGNSKNKEKTFIIVAAHSFYKNYDLFIKIFDRLTEITNIPFRVMIVGYGSNKGYSKNEDELVNKIQKSKFSKYADLIPEVSHEKIQEYYGRADAFVMTSIQEGMPVSALEAACCGLPIFSTMCGGVEDYVDDKIGRIYKIIDSESFAQGLKEYLEGDIVFDREQIRKKIINLYGKYVFKDRMAQIFYDVMNK